MCQTLTKLCVGVWQRKKYFFFCFEQRSGQLFPSFFLVFLTWVRPLLNDLFTKLLPIFTSCVTKLDQGLSNFLLFHGFCFAVWPVIKQFCDFSLPKKDKSELLRPYQGGGGQALVVNTTRIFILF